MKTKPTILHDATRGDLCSCACCDAEKLASLASSRALSAIQAAAWRPRSRRLAAAAKAAIIDRDQAAQRLRDMEI